MRQQVEVKTCDKCGIEYNDHFPDSFSVVIGGCTDASGNNATEYLSFELCPKCRSWLLGKFLEEWNRKPGVEAFFKQLLPTARTEVC
jgi:hypothetical protein